jgi:hypothetical protein
VNFSTVSLTYLSSVLQGLHERADANDGENYRIIYNIHQNMLLLEIIIDAIRVFCTKDRQGQILHYKGDSIIFRSKQS